MSLAAELPAIPEKLAFKIGEASGLVGVKAHVLRFWEREFPSVRPRKSNNGHRIYSQNDVRQLRRIRALLHDRGYTIAGARALLKDGTVAVEAALAARPAEAAVALEEIELQRRSLEALLRGEEQRRRDAEKALHRAREEALFWREAAQEAEGRLEALRGQVTAEADGLASLLQERSGA